jgi:hypothetical protein
MIDKELNTGEPVAHLWIHKGCIQNVLLFKPDNADKEHWKNKGWESRPCYSQDYVNQLLGEIEILKLQISNLDLENIALNEELESYLFK